MRGIRLLLFVVLAGGAVLAALLVLRLLGPAPAARPQPVPRGDQEIAWIHAATSGSSWERFVQGARQLKDSWPDLVVDFDRAFPEQTAAVPEITLHPSGQERKLRVRWYKLTSEMGIEQWVQALAARAPAPLAIIGGGSSDRARDLALALHHQPQWRGAAPLLLITTATADKVIIDAAGLTEQKLTEIFPERTFRFCFQNSQMAEAVTDFVWGRPDLRPHADPVRLAAWAAVALGAGRETPRLLGALAGLLPNLPAPVVAVGWQDDPYSADLARRFQEELHRPERGPTTVTQYNIPYTVGGYNEPNRREVGLVAKLAQDISHTPRQRRLLVLPTLVKPARRVLRKLADATPAAVRNVVAVTGDSITFNNVYRDRAVAWNVQEVPVALVFFCHQDPVSWPAEFWRVKDLARGRESGTDDVLLNTDLLGMVVDAAHQGAGFLDQVTADTMAGRLRGRQPAFFGPDGNRLGGSGEFVVCLRPLLKGEEVRPAAVVEVWRREGGPDGQRWQPHRQFEVRYDVHVRDEERAHAGP